jgi:hypothetical protein
MTRFFIFLVVANQAGTAKGLTTNNYLESLSPVSKPVLQKVLARPHSIDDDADQEGPIPEEHYAYHAPMAGWAGYKHKNWGACLDNLTNATVGDETSEMN